VACSHNEPVVPNAARKESSQTAEKRRGRGNLGGDAAKKASAWKKVMRQCKKKLQTPWLGTHTRRKNPCGEKADPNGPKSKKPLSKRPTKLNRG